ncbi:major facilitator superfamily domain-containing protein [Boeremia exigua]|uniref:major facilitator superfamily domain-containing protein n=1 Tax=Boeremia exigua TaxID=749465 RepID=UPI001E8DD906|nr:major facilitator superfamily domain-containing protein [Boeremia exigua]KAH6616648.1 major facilitator superfamily domain-containing protein [Boeremia exigua]
MDSSRCGLLSHVQFLVSTSEIEMHSANLQRGLINAFGAFQEYYGSFTPALSTPSSISWIGSLQTFLLLACGSATGSFVDRGHARLMSLIGGALITLGLLFTSFSGEFTDARRPVYYQVLLSQGILSGLGMSLLLVPSTAIVPTYFTENRAFAVGIANTGASLGGIVYPILARRLLTTVGFSWAMRATALVVLVTTGVGCLLVRQRSDLTKSPAKRTLYQFGCLKDYEYALFVAGIFFTFAGIYIPYFYISAWVQDTEFPLHGMSAYYLISIMNAGGLFGRIIPNFVADKFISGPVLTQALAAIACGALAAGWTYIKTSLAGLIVWVVAYGFVSGSVISLIPASAATLTRDMSTLGGRIGVLFAGNAIASLIGNPVAGAIQRQTDSGWRGLASYSAVFNVVSGCFLAACWTLNVRRKRKSERADVEK